MVILSEREREKYELRLKNNCNFKVSNTTLTPQFQCQSKSTTTHHFWTPLLTLRGDCVANDEIYRLEASLGQWKPHFL